VLQEEEKKTAETEVGRLHCVSVSLLVWGRSCVGVWYGSSGVWVGEQLTKFPMYTLDLRRLEFSRNRAGQNYEYMH